MFVSSANLVKLERVGSRTTLGVTKPYGALSDKRREKARLNQTASAVFKAACNPDRGGELYCSACSGVRSSVIALLIVHRRAEKDVWTG